MDRQVQQKFLKGINRRFNVSNQDDPTRVYAAQNARLQKRGETGQVSRINGYAVLANSPVIAGEVHDSIMYDNDIVVLSHDGADVNIHIFDVDTDTLVDSFNFTEASLGYGKLVLSEDTIFITPYNRQLSRIGGDWYLNAFKSTTPLLVAALSEQGTKATSFVSILEDGPTAVDTEATAQFWTPQNAPGGDASVTVKYPLGEVDEEEVVIPYLGSDSIEDLVNKVVAGINADGDIQTTADPFNAATEVGFTEKRAGAEFDGNLVEVDYPADAGPVTVEMEGGQTTGDVAGTLKFNLGEDDFIETEVLYGDLAADIASNLEDSANDDADSPNFTGEIDGVDDFVLNLEAKEAGELWNVEITKEETGDVDLSTGFPDFTGGESADGFLEVGSVYWYMARIKYQDNHKTTESFAQIVKIGPLTPEGSVDVRAVALSVTTPPDLDEGFVDIEIFRRKDDEGFFLIDRVTVESLEDWEYVDPGKLKIRALSPLNYVWNETESGAAIVRDRLVRAGVDFMNREYDPTPLGAILTDADDEYSTIPGVDFYLYARKRFEDGLLSPHVLFETLEGVEDDTFEISHFGVIEKEIGFYAGFNRQFIPGDKTITFPTLEIYNANVPSILTAEEDEADQDRPTNPHIFLGFGQFQRRHDGSGNITHFIRDTELSGVATSFYEFDSFSISPDDFETVMPTYIELEIIEGQTVLYKRIATQNVGSTGNSGVYEIAWLPALKEYISTQEFSIRLVGLEDSVRLSTLRTENEFLNTDVEVLGYDDLADGEPNRIIVSPSLVSPADLNRVYLLLPPGTIYDDFNLESFNNEGIKDDWDTAADLSGRGTFNMLNIDYVRDEAPTSEVLSQNGEDYVKWTYQDEVQQPVPTFALEDSVVYLGSMSGGEVDTLKFETYPAGVEKVTSNGFVRWVLPDHAILETLITQEELDLFQENYPTLLIWSEPFVLGTGINGLRNFTFTNFKSISKDYGPIIDIQYINNILLVFCERGVNQVGVGETLTQQASGEVFVSSAQFLTNDFWLLKHLPDIQRVSIVQYENMLFFCDGKDVWNFVDKFDNITNGAIEIDGEIVAAGVDPANKEYRITDQSQTWAYSIELGEWMGPYTYTDQVPAGYRDRFFAVTGGEIIEHNIGNDFDGVGYESFIESVAIDLNNVSVDKLWRKFLLQLDGQIPVEQDTEVLEFQYGREYDDKFVKNLFDVAKKSGLYHIGVNPDEHNATQLYWSVRTDIEDFVIRSFAYDLLLRNRP